MLRHLSIRPLNAIDSLCQLTDVQVDGAESTRSIDGEGDDATSVDTGEECVLVAFVHVLASDAVVHGMRCNTLLSFRGVFGILAVDRETTPLTPCR